MTNSTPWRTIAREWFWMLACYALVIAPFGCELQSGGLIGGTADTSGVGLFVNEDTDDPLLIAGQNADGDAFFVFGTRDADGNLEEIESISVRTADGEESFVTFESGRPVHVQGPDGSYAHITYTEVSVERLAATVELYDVNSAETSTQTVDIDLAKTAEQIAEIVHDATGLTLDTTALDAGTAKSKDATARTRITIFSPLYFAFIVPLVAAVTLMTVILGQVLALMLELVVVTLEIVLLSIFSPLFLIAEILSDTVFRVELIPLTAIFDTLPSEPIVILF